MALSSVVIRSVASDGTNIYLEVEVFNGDVTLPLIRPVFPVGTTAATIRTYLTTIANNRPSLPADILAMVNSPITGV